LGGPVRAGQLYRWQEEGRELFVPRTDGQVISTRQLRGAAAPAAPRISVGGITINAAPGMSPTDVARAVRKELAAMARETGFALNDGGDYA
ncbi:tail tape measure protein, partial [Cereibacter changlensis]